MQGFACVVVAEIIEDFCRIRVFGTDFVCIYFKSVGLGFLYAAAISRHPHVHDAKFA